MKLLVSSPHLIFLMAWCSCRFWKSSHAWQPPIEGKTKTRRIVHHHKTQLFQTSENTSDVIVDRRRRHLLQSVAVVAAATMVVPAPSFADVTNKIASSTALRSLTRARDQLPAKLLPETQRNNFVGVKARLREPPLDTIRKDGLILIRGGEDGPKAKELLVSYKKLIQALEAIDATASLGMRGRKMDPFLMGVQYEDIAKALDAFINVGTAAAEIPLQEAPSMQETLRYGSITSKTLTSE